LRPRVESATIRFVQRRLRLPPLAVVALGLCGVGCGGPALDPEDPGGPAPDGVEVVAPRLDPPPPRGDALDRPGVLRVAQGHVDPADAIVELDTRRFAFALDDPAIEWFGQQGVDPQVLDYLRKRAAIDWDALRGDVDPDGPQ
jgi:hypothetical protein